MKNKRIKNVDVLRFIIFILFLIWFIYFYIISIYLRVYIKYLFPIFFILLVLLFIPKSKGIINKKLLLTTKILIYFIFFSFFIIYIWKSFYIKDSFFVLYLYWVSVTYVLLIIFYVAIFKYEDPYLLAKEIINKNEKLGIKINKPLVSCVVAVYNEEKLVEWCIKSMINQTYENIEIIFVNDKSTDKTIDILNKYKKQWKIIVIDLEKNVWKKKAIAEWIKLSKWNIIAMSDSDSVWDSKVIEKMVKIFAVFDNVWWVSWHWRALNASKNIFTKVQDSWYEWQFSIRKAFESVYWSITCISWPLAVFRREAIFNYIPAWINDSFLWQEFKFATDRTLTWFVLWSKVLWKKLKKQYNDSYFVKSVNYKERDWDIVYSKSTKSWTNVPDTFWKIITQQVRWKKSFIRNIFLTGSFYRRKPLLPALFYYLHVLFVFIWPVISFRHIIYFPIKWDLLSPIFYLLWIVYVWLLFWIAFKIENRNSNIWIYRPLMSLLSTLVISWLIFYSLFTIKKMIWIRN